MLPIAFKKTIRRNGGVAALILVLVVLSFPAGSNALYGDLLVRACLNAVVAIGLNLLIGYTGQISIGHAGFFGLGAYASAILTKHWAWPSWLALTAGAIAAGLLAFVIARPMLRLRGHNLAMGTLGFGIIVAITINNESALTGGPDGMSVTAFMIAGHAVLGDIVWYAIAATTLVVFTAAALNLVQSPAGRALQAVHSSEVAAQMMGIDVARTKERIFIVSAVMASLMGSLTAHYVGYVTPGLAGFLQSVEFVIMVVLGGMGSVFGSIIGAAVVTTLPQLLTSFQDWETAAYGMILVIVMIFLPRGIVPSLARLVAKRLAG